MLRLNTLGLAAQTLAGVETLLHIAIVLDVLTTDLEILGSPVEGVEVNISCQTEDLGNVTPTLRLPRLGLAAQTWAGVETLLHIAIVLDVLTTDLDLLLSWRL